MRRILVPLDGSPDGEVILRELPCLLTNETRVELLHVLPELHSPPGESPAVDINLEKMAEVYLENVARRIPAHSVRTSVWRGNAAEEILTASSALHADLIAMTTHARKGLEHLLMGGVAESVVRHSPLPVFVTRPGLHRTPRPLRRILVPIDGSDSSRQILGPVRELTGSAPVEFVLLHVVVPLVITDPVTGFTPIGVPNPVPDPIALVREDAARLAQEGCRARAEIAYGGAVDQILGYARALDTDLIALASSARGGLSRFFLGSVADDVVRLSDCPVLLQRIVPVLGSRTHESGHHGHEAD
jgi:nucleotide-binding universal stress UspA family protein